jgi:heme/copper-type cytochrome/quinol oxidase subunit 2
VCEDAGLVEVPRSPGSPSGSRTVGDPETFEPSKPLEITGAARPTVIVTVLSILRWHR